MAKQYSPEIIANCRKLYVYDNWSYRKISNKFYDGSPHWQTIKNWAEDPHPETGRNWEEERQAYIDRIVYQITPKQIKQKYMQRIWEIVNDPNFSTKDSDALRKLQKDFRDMTDPGKQIPVLYALLEDYINYLRQYHDGLISNEFLEATRDFKNYKRKQLQD